MSSARLGDLWVFNFIEKSRDAGIEVAKEVTELLCERSRLYRADRASHADDGQRR
jgi:hypothetical protein